MVQGVGGDVAFQLSGLEVEPGQFLRTEHHRHHHSARPRAHHVKQRLVSLLAQVAEEVVAHLVHPLAAPGKEVLGDIEQFGGQHVKAELLREMALEAGQHRLAKADRTADETVELLALAVVHLGQQELPVMQQCAPNDQSDVSHSKQP